MKVSLTLFSLALFSGLLFSQTKTPKRKVFTTTPTLSEIDSTYEALAKNAHSIAHIIPGEKSDGGHQLNLVVLSHNLAPGNVKILVNNGIHPGEPDGIDACIELMKLYCNTPSLLPENVDLYIIPVYNADGCVNRGSTSRVNQNGPAEYGFRGNAKNLDLNRDFIKADSRNTLFFELTFRNWNPDIFIDTHVSDGADYQYVMTLIPTQHSKLNSIVADFMDKQMVPALYADMKKKNYEMCPYVEEHGETPDEGIDGFLETPRFSTGYASLFNCISFVTETHMWKPYNDRVWATYEFLLSVINYASKNATAILKTHHDADSAVSVQKTFPLNWSLDTTKFEWISFKGFEAKHKLSEISGQQRLYYDRKAPYTKQIKFYNTYSPTVSVNAPAMYIIPQAWYDAINLLSVNKVEMKQLKKDTALKVEMYYITDYHSPQAPYESHYLHSGVQVKVDTQIVQFYKGDYVMGTNQPANRYIVETLEPQGGDSFFAWNFFDGILQQKEWFSDYIFEDKCDSILKSDPALKAELISKQKSDSAFAKNNWAQLSFIYQHSGYMEKTFKRYPVARINEFEKLPVK